jgi:hypothetical protein
VDRALFVSHQDMLNGRSGQFVIDVYYSASGKTEQGVHTFFLKNCHQDLRSGQSVFNWFHIYSYSTTAPVLADETFREYLAK